MMLAYRQLRPRPTDLTDEDIASIDKAGSSLPYRVQSALIGMAFKFVLAIPIIYTGFALYRAAYTFM
jgi:hypothetical protein